MKSENIAELAKALAEAQKEIKHAKKDAKNPFFKSNYSTLESISDACMPALNKNGLAVTQVTRHEGERTVLCTMLVHSSGQWIESIYPINPVKNDPQSVGSAMSYARRYSLAAIAGVVTSDDDGEAAMDRQSAAPEPRATHKSEITVTATTPKPTKLQLAELFDTADTNGWTEVDMKKYMSETLGIDSTSRLTFGQWASFVKYIKAMPKTKA